MDYQRTLLKSGFSTLLASLVVVALLAIPGRSGAANMDIWPQTPTTSMGWFGATFVSASSFEDHYTFTAPTAFTLTLDGGSNGSWNIGNLQATVYDSGPSTVYGPIAGVLNTTPSASLLAGNYDLKITGDVAAGGGSYWGAVTLTTAPVPEPETYAMMLAGLGLMGFVARRRRQK
jgi:hypothetical protein